MPYINTFSSLSAAPLVRVLVITLSVLALGCANPLSSTQTTAVNGPSARIKPVNISNQAIKDYQVAIAAMDAKEWQKAEILLQEMQVSYPKLISVRVNLSIAYKEQQRIEEAINELEAVIVSDRLSYSDAHNLLAITYREQGQFTEAENIYRQAVKRWPSEPALSRNLGILYDLYLDQPVQALAAYKQAQSLMSQPDKTLKRWVRQLERRTKAAPSTSHGRSS